MSVAYGLSYTATPRSVSVEQLRDQQRSTPPPAPDRADPDQPSSVVRTLTAQLAELKRRQREEAATLRHALEAAHGENLELRRRLPTPAAAQRTED
ncbi:MAG TPA: hypothetical protein VIW24_25650 [Aldersonia sp.]